MKKKAFKVIQVNWEDPCSCNEGWTHLDSVNFEDDFKCISVGFLVHEDSKSVSIAQNIGDIDSEDFQISKRMRIPKSCIKKIIKLADINIKTKD